MSQMNSMSSISTNRSSDSPTSEDKMKSPKTSPKGQIREQIKESVYRGIVQLLIKNKVSAITLLLLLGGAGVFYYFYPGDPIYENMNFEFLYHCPISYALASERIQNSPFGSQVKDYLKDYYTQLNSSYYVAAKTIFALKDGQQKDYTRPLKILYCGYARLYNQTCEQADFACSAPGPAFDVEAYKTIQVIWINNYTKPDLDEGMADNSLDQVQGVSDNTCFDKTSMGHAQQGCRKKTKFPNNSGLYMFQPSDQLPDVTKFCSNERPQNLPTIYNISTSRQAIPLSPHIHGLEVQPQFDGNPLSWWDNQGEIGVGFIKSQDQRIEFLENCILRNVLSWIGFNGNYKINIYRNSQQPGTLWYHDHAMGITSFNVRLGLHSYYIIRDQKVESKLPSGEYEKFIFMYTGIKNPLYMKNCIQACKIPGSQKCQKCLRGSGVKSMQQLPLKYNSTYRFRILNGDYDELFEKIQFKLMGCNADSTKCENQTLSFSIIGSDSALRRKSVDNVSVINRMTPAQRLDLLITIQNKKTPRQYVNITLLVICKGIKEMNEGQQRNQTLLASWNIINNTQTGKRMNINNVSLDVPFVNLSSIPQSDIAVRRMRPLLFSNEFTFGINGHLKFSQGASENPKIGTVQDWYIVNGMRISHPIHIHLIQYQVLELYALKIFEVLKIANCSYYMMDFLKYRADEAIRNNKSNSLIDQAIKFTNNFQNYTLTCIYTSQMSTEAFLTFFKEFKNQATKDSKNISGLNVLEECLNKNCSGIYGEGEKTDNIYKYINKSVDTSEFLQDYQRGWKETFWVPKFTYAKFRMRWTRTDFPQEFLKPTDPGNNPQGCKRGYFTISEEAITRSPGYVYHCHILSHEDNDMMRPIMVQPSGCDKTLLPWRQRYQKQFCSYKPKNSTRCPMPQSNKFKDQNLRK